MSDQFSWPTASNKRIPSATDFAILQELATSGDFVSRYTLIYMPIRGTSVGAKSNSIETLKQKGAVETRQKEGHPYLKITEKGRGILATCQEASKIFSEMEASFQGWGW